jgi:hypothetical protein
MYMVRIGHATLLCWPSFTVGLLRNMAALRLTMPPWKVRDINTIRINPFLSYWTQRVFSCGLGG